MVKKRPNRHSLERAYITQQADAWTLAQFLRPNSALEQVLRSQHERHYRSGEDPERCVCGLPWLCPYREDADAWIARADRVDRDGADTPKTTGGDTSAG